MQPAERSDAREQLKNATIQILQQAKRHPVPSRRLQKEIARTVDSFRAATLLSLLDDLVANGTVTVFADGPEPEYFWTGNLAYLKDRLCALVGSYHRANPHEPGMKRGDIRRRFAEAQTVNAQRNIDTRLFELAMTACKKDGLVVDAACGVRLSSFTPKVRDRDESRGLESEILRQVDEGFCVHLDVDRLARQHNVNARTVNAVITCMVISGILLRLARKYPVKEFRYLRRSTVEHAKTVLARELTSRSRMSTSEMRIVLGWTRSTTIPLLEYLDSVGFTRRDGDYRLLAGTAGDGGADAQGLGEGGSDHKTGCEARPKAGGASPAECLDGVHAPRMPVRTQVGGKQRSRGETVKTPGPS